MHFRRRSQPPKTSIDLMDWLLCPVCEALVRKTAMCEHAAKLLTPAFMTNHAKMMFVEVLLEQRDEPKDIVRFLNDEWMFIKQVES